MSQCPQRFPMRSWRWSAPQCPAHAGLAVHRQNVAGGDVANFDFHARLAGNQIALWHAAGAESITRNFDGRFVGGIAVPRRETALLQYRRQFRLRCGINDARPLMLFIDLQRKNRL